MKITKSQLKQLIREEISLINERVSPGMEGVNEIAEKVKRYAAGIQRGLKTEGGEEWIKNEAIPALEGLVNKLKNIVTAPAAEPVDIPMGPGPEPL
jgi:hypothetical protein